MAICTQLVSGGHLDYDADDEDGGPDCHGVFAAYAVGNRGDQEGPYEGAD